MLASALIYRCALLVLLIFLVLVLKLGPRKLALAMSVLVFWTCCVLFDLAVANENAVYNIMEGMLLPQPCAPSYASHTFSRLHANVSLTIPSACHSPAGTPRCRRCSF